MDLEKRLLGKVFGKREISHHAHANGKHAPLVIHIKFCECIMVTGLGASDNIGLLALPARLGRFEFQRLKAS